MSQSNITLEQKKLAEQVIRSKWKLYSEYHHWDIGYLVNLFKNIVNPVVKVSNIEASKVIENVLLNVALPSIFIRYVEDENGDEQEDTPNIEVISGYKYVITLYDFVSDNFSLTGLKYLKEVNGFKFSDLIKARRLRFLRSSVRVIQLKKDYKMENL